MTNRLEQQDPSVNFNIPKSAATPQHGQKPDREKKAKLLEPRSFEPRPGH